MNKIKSVITVMGLSFVLVISGCKGKGPEQEVHRKASGSHMESNENIIHGKVLESMNAAGYTYLHMDTGNEKVWVAIPEAKIEKGQTIKVVPDMKLENFKSKSLNRVFDRIIFATLLSGHHGRQPSPHDVAEKASEEMHMNMGAAMGMGGRSKTLPLPKDFKVEKAPGENGYTISQIYEKRTELNGKTVRVNGYVTKVLTDIMGKNWIHIKDGTETSSVTDLVITTNDLPNPGDIITATGKLSSDRDFGAGYRYDAILEDAKLTVISKNLPDLSKK